MKRIVYLFGLFLLIFSLSSCGEVVKPDIKDPIIIPDDDPSDTPINNDNPTDIEFTCTLMFNDKVLNPTSLVKAIWYNSKQQKSEDVIDGVAKVKGLDGDYNVHLSGEIKDQARNVYTYNPNIYVATNDRPNVVIELILINSVKTTASHNGTKLYNALVCDGLGTYRTPLIKEAPKKVEGNKDLPYSGGIYYDFRPTVSGVYEIESLVDIYADEYNPRVIIFQGSSAWKQEWDNMDSGGTDRGGFTKNFKWSVRVTDDMIGNTFGYCILCESKLNQYPTTVDFTIRYLSDYQVDEEESIVIMAKEADFKTPEFQDEYGFNMKYQIMNPDNTTGRYYDGIPASNYYTVMDGNNYAYDPDYVIPDSNVKGIWRRIEKDQDGNIVYKEPLLAYITEPGTFYEEALSRIESHGNKNLTVSNGKENYKIFIERSYAACANKMGLCYVTMELKEFLQKFSMSQELFIDGKGWCEYGYRVYCAEVDQWLFDCCYIRERMN